VNKSSELFIETKNYSLDLNQKPLFPQNKNFIYSLDKKESLTTSPNIFRYTFKNIEGLNHMDKFYSGLELAGKGFNLVMLSSKKNRYYTICNTLGSTLWNDC